MITLGGFVLGLCIFAVGFSMVGKAIWWHDYVGNLSDILGYPQLEWLDWNVLGIIVMALGVIVAFGLFQIFLVLTLGKLFQFSI